MTTDPLPGRKAHPGEVPAFGSVWTWNTANLHYVALGLGPANTLGWRHLVSVIAESGNLGQGDVIWSVEGEPLGKWRCVTEAP